MGEEVGEDDVRRDVDFEVNVVVALRAWLSKHGDTLIPQHTLLVRLCTRRNLNAQDKISESRLFPTLGVGILPSPRPLFQLV